MTVDVAVTMATTMIVGVDVTIAATTMIAGVDAVAVVVVVVVVIVVIADGIVMTRM